MKTGLLLILILLMETAFSQEEKDSYYVFDSHWQPAPKIKPAYFLRVRKESDSQFVWTYYKMYGPRIKVESFKDQKATIPNGKFAYYNESGFIDSVGHYLNGKRQGSWYYYNWNGKWIRQIDFIQGLVVRDIKNLENNKSWNDSDSLKQGEVESEFPGGQKAWLIFLNDNLHYPDRAMNAKAKGEVRITFIIDANGIVQEADVSRSVEYSIDEEALRVISISGQWVPATKNQVKVKSYKIQPINFGVE